MLNSERISLAPSPFVPSLQCQPHNYPPPVIAALNHNPLHCDWVCDRQSPFTPSPTTMTYTCNASPGPTAKPPANRQRQHRPTSQTDDVIAKTKASSRSNFTVNLRKNKNTARATSSHHVVTKKSKQQTLPLPRRQRLALAKASVPACRNRQTHWSSSAPHSPFQKPKKGKVQVRKKKQNLSTPKRTTSHFPDDRTPGSSRLCTPI
jgi:hypothetical protein